MTRKVFIGKFSNFIQLAVKLNEKSRRYGIASLENEVEDIDDEFFKQGLRLVIDKADKALINEILSNKIASEKNKNTRTFMKIQKRTVLAIHEGLGQRLLVLILLSLVKLPRKELHEIEWELLKDSPSDNNDIETDFDIADIEEKERSFDENFAIAKKCYTAGDRYRNYRNYEKAINYFECALTYYKKVHNKNHQDIIDTLCFIGICYEALDNYEKAIKYFNDTAAADEEVNGKDNQSIAIYLNQISTCYAKLKDFQNALKYAIEALAIREKILGTEHLDTACLYQKAADIYYLQDDIKNALVFYLKAHKVYKENNGEEDENTIYSGFMIADCYYTLKDFEKSLEYDLEVLKAREKICDEDAPDLSLSYNNTGTDYRVLGKYEEAIKYHLKALELRKKYNSQKDHIAFSFSNVGKDYEAKGDKKNAQKYFTEALLIYKSIEGFDKEAEEAKQAVERNS